MRNQLHPVELTLVTSTRDRESAPFTRRLAGSLVIVAFGAMAHLWIVPSTSPARTAPAPATPGIAQIAALAPAAGMARALAAQLGDVIVREEFVQPRIITATGVSLDGVPRAVGTSGRLLPASVSVRAADPAGRAEPQHVLGAGVLVEEERPTEPAPPSTPSWADVRPVGAMADAVPIPVSSTDDSGIDEPVATLEAAAGATPGTAMRAEEELVYLAVQEYRSAYERLDAAAAKSVWPTVDAQALRNAFNQLAQQRLTFESCGVTIRGDAASARCRGQAEYLPKVGGRRAFVKAGEWVFDLARHDASWQIVSAKIY